ncbi:hypothetical protein RRG08_005819 [Elysia crispata]|uniref:Uncharacterized protein n=1 Tax=Elysia crispata TaxID=231223 RepID=A0AAE1AS54_9GAST|nr:hypothetical protein RRG08_005819 [Elysia crispata]
MADANTESHEMAAKEKLLDGERSAAQPNGTPENGQPVAVEEDDRVVLKQKLGLMNGVTVIVGCIIGSGIFVSPRGVLIHTGSPGMSLLIWTLCGVYSMIGAYCYAELGTSIVRSGADYAYIFEAFGPFLAFLRLWVECIIVRPCTTAIVALTFATYITEPLFPTCDQPSVSVTCLAAVCICECALILCVFYNHISKNPIESNAAGKNK